MCHGDEDAAGDQDGCGCFVEELEAPVVNAALEEATGGLRHGPDQVRHLASLPSKPLHANSHHVCRFGRCLDQRKLGFSSSSAAEQPALFFWWLGAVHGRSESLTPSCVILSPHMKALSFCFI